MDSKAKYGNPRTPWSAKNITRRAKLPSQMEEHGNAQHHQKIRNTITDEKTTTIAMDSKAKSGWTWITSECLKHHQKSKNTITDGRSTAMDSRVKS